MGGVVLEERTFDNFSVGRYSTAHYQVVDLEDVQLRIVKVPQTIRLRAQRQRRPRYVSIRYANQDARPTVHRLANSCVSHDYPTFFVILRGGVCFDSRFHLLPCHWLYHTTFHHACAIPFLLKMITSLLFHKNVENYSVYTSK